MGNSDQAATRAADAGSSRLIEAAVLSRSELASVLARTDDAVDVIHLDLDRFHQVNTRYGQELGDRVLEVITRRIRRRIPPSGVLCLVGGNGYVVVLVDPPSGTATGLAGELLRTVGEPVRIDGQDIAVRASAGVARRSVGGTGDPIEAAFAACRAAKTDRPGGIVDALALLGPSLTDLPTDSELVRAIEVGEFILRYQPEVDLRTGQVVGLEALIRWNHPERGELAPGAWMATAEAAGLMAPIGEWVVAEAIDQAARMASVDPRPTRLWVNLSASQLVNLSRIRQMIVSQVQMGFDTSWLGFEVTESGLLHDLDRTVAALTELRGLGVEMALDDFGTGYSSLAYLRRLPVSAVKIDRSFVSGVGGSLADTVIVDAVTDLAHALDLIVVAEGVEELSQLEALRDAGVDRAQGYWLARPALATDVPALLGPWCGRPVESKSTYVAPSTEGRRAQMLFSALDALGSPAVVTVVPSSTGSTLPAVVSANAAFLERFAADGVGPVVLGDVVDRDADPSGVARWRQLLTGSAAGTVRVACRTADGTSRPWDIEVRPFDDVRGQSVYRIQMFRPALGADALNLDVLVAMVDSSSEGIGVFDDEGCLRWSNDNGLMSRRPASLIGRPMHELVLADDQVRARHWMQQALLNETIDPLVVRVEASDGVRWLEARRRPNDPRIDGILLTTRDVTDEVRGDQTKAARDRLEQVAFAVSRRALELSPGEFLDNALELLGELAEWLAVDEVWIDVLEDGVQHNLALWSPRTPVEREHDEPVWMEAVGRFLMGHDDLLAVDDVETSTLEWLVTVRRQMRADRAIIVAPLVSAGEVLGNFGVSMLDAPRRWTDAEISLCRRVAETIANVLVRDRTATAWRMSQDRLDAVLNASAELIGVVDEVGRLRFTNDRADQYLGLPEHTDGAPLSDYVHPDDIDGLIESFVAAIERGEVRRVECRLRRVDGEYRWFEVTNGVTLDPALRGAVLSARDITARRESRDREQRRVAGLEFGLTVAQRALDLRPTDFIEQLRPLLRMAAELLGTDTLYVNVVDESSEMLTVLAGWAAPHLVEDPTNVDPVLRSTAPRWFRRLERLDPLLIEDTTCLPPPEVNAGSEGRAALLVPMSAAGRLVGVVGASMWSQTRRWTDDDVTILRLLGDTIANVLVRQRLDEALAGSEARFRLMSEASVDVIGLCDGRGVITYVSPSSDHVLGRGPDELVGTPVLGLMRDDAPGRIETMLVALDQSGWQSFEIEMRHADGHYLWAGITVSRVRAGESGRTQYRFSMRDISDIKRLQGELHRRALHDPLTGLANRVLLQQRLENVLVDAEDPSCSVMLIDLDGFKQVNDTLGHAVGDDVLRLMAARLSALAGPNDTLARFGGDEFVLLCPGMSRVDAVVLGERIVESMSREVPVSNRPVQLGASVGIAVSQSRPDASRLLIEADRAMYDAKRAGKGCVRSTVVNDDLRS